ncbi:MAG TPA: carboxypeptidase-like regulatory domain-containing protein [Tahibacter sp.]|nr:carboxypeptidase-like regulatory domain-containing protein [Tahibacter sp.]
MSFKYALAALALAFAAGAAVAQNGTGAIFGTVVDTSTKKPVPDAVVTATSPSLQGEQTVVTDSNGGYRIPDLPPGAYTLRIEADGYRPYERGGIVLEINRTIRVDAELLPDAVPDR